MKVSKYLPTMTTRDWLVIAVLLGMSLCFSMGFSASIDGDDPISKTGKAIMELLQGKWGTILGICATSACGAGIAITGDVPKWGKRTLVTGLGCAVIILPAKLLEAFGVTGALF